MTGERRARGGPYDDAPAAYYSWDSTVPQHAEPQPGDGVILRDEKHLLGTSVIEILKRGTAIKEIGRCPSCGHGRYKPRKRKRPTYRCPCGEEFDAPKTQLRKVTTYRAHYEAGWMDLTGQLTAAQLKPMTESPGSQQAIRPINMTQFWRALGDPRATPFEAAMARAVPGGHKTRIARVRVGQPAFRQAMLNMFGSVCAFTGPGPREALQAAHLYSFAKSGKHDLYGGWLMRSDLHSLFDVGHVAVHPVSLTIDVTPDVRRYAAYGALHGGRLHIKADVQHRKWLDLHWARNR